MKAAIVVLFLLIANALFAASGEKIPATAPGKIMDAWLTAYNAADEAALTRFVEERTTPEARGGRAVGEFVELQMESRQASGGFDLFQTERSEPRELDVILKSRGLFPRFVRLSTQVGDNPEKLIKRIAGPVPPPADVAPERKPPAEVAQELDAKLEDLSAKDQFAGVALIAKDGKPIWVKAYGLQDREKNVIANVATRYRLGSMNKMFTAVAIAQLVEAGKLKFTDKLADVLPDYPDKEIAQKVTIEQLLTHTSGLGDIFGPAFFEKKDSLRDLKDYLPLFAGKPLNFEPGTSWSYSNAGFIVLGLIIEKISGKTYYEYVQKHIYEPAGMAASGNTPKTERPEGLAVGYMQDPKGKWVPNWESLPYRGMSAGGGESNVMDLLAFANALRDSKLLSAEMTEKVTTGKAEMPGGTNKYAYGFGDRQANGIRVVGHNGGAPGMNADLSILWDSGYTIAVLANLGPTVAQDAAQFIAERVK